MNDIDLTAEDLLVLNQELKSLKLENSKKKNEIEKLQKQLEDISKLNNEKKNTILEQKKQIDQLTFDITYYKTKIQASASFDEGLKQMNICNEAIKKNKIFNAKLSTFISSEIKKTTRAITLRLSVFFILLSLELILTYVFLFICIL